MISRLDRWVGRRSPFLEIHRLIRPAWLVSIRWTTVQFVLNKDSQPPPIESEKRSTQPKLPRVCAQQVESKSNSNLISIRICRFYTWRRPSQRLEDDDEVPQIGLSRIWSRFLDRIFDNSDRRQYGMGVVGRVFG